MEQVIVELLGGKLDGATLLMLFIVGILTKRFVPWWVHEEALEKLREYEEAAPALLDEVQMLIDLINDAEQPYRRRPQQQRVRERKEELTNVVQRHPKVLSRRRRRMR